MLKLVACERYFPWIAKTIRARHPQLLFLKQPNEPGKAHVTPYLGVVRHWLIGRHQSVTRYRHLDSVAAASAVSVTWIYGKSHRA